MQIKILCNFQTWPTLGTYVHTLMDGERVNQAAPFTEDHINTFLSQADSSNMYILVRKVVAIVGKAF